MAKVQSERVKLRQLVEEFLNPSPSYDFGIN